MRVALPYRPSDPIPRQREKRFDAASAIIENVDLSAAQWLAARAVEEDESYGGSFADSVKSLQERLAKAADTLDTVNYWRAGEGGTAYERLQGLRHIADMLGYKFDEYGELTMARFFLQHVRRDFADFLRYFGIEANPAALLESAYNHEYASDLEEYLGGLEVWERIEQMEQGLDRINAAIDEIEEYSHVMREKVEYASKWQKETMSKRPEKVFPEGLGRYEKMWHVTTAYDAVLREGLKSKEQLNAPAGLGGGSYELISFTASLRHAEEIFDAMLAMTSLVQGPRTFAAMKELADAYGLSEEGWQKALASYKQNYGELDEPISENNFANLYQAVSMYLSEEGAAYAAFFFDYDTGKKFARIDPDQIGVIEAVVDTSDPETTYHRAEEEWRIPPENVLSIGPIGSQDDALAELQKERAAMSRLANAGLNDWLAALPDDDWGDSYERSIPVRTALEQPKLRRELQFLLDYLDPRTEDYAMNALDVYGDEFLDWLFRFSDFTSMEKDGMLQEWFDPAGVKWLEEELELDEPIETDRDLRDALYDISGDVLGEWIWKYADNGIMDDWMDPDEGAVHSLIHGLGGGASMQTIYFFHDPTPVPKQWLVHFAKFGTMREIQQQGFLYGEDDPTQLGLTAWDEQAPSGAPSPGYGFGYTLDEYEEYMQDPRYEDWGGWRYNTDAVVMLRAPGIHVYHATDKDESVIFWGPDATDIVAIVPVQDEDQRFYHVMNCAGDSVYEAESLPGAVAWVVQNYSAVPGLSCL